MNIDKLAKLSIFNKIGARKLARIHFSVYSSRQSY